MDVLDVVERELRKYANSRTISGIETFNVVPAEWLIAKIRDAVKKELACPEKV